MKHKIFQFSLILVTFFLAFFSWLSVDRAIRVPEASAWLVPIVWFSLLMVSFCVLAIFAKGKYLFFLTPLVAFSFSLIFAFSFWHLLILILGALLMAWGLTLIRNDLGLNVKISLWKSLLRGKSQLIVAVAIIISSQYFFTIQKMDGAKVLPKFDLSPVASKLFVPIFGIVNPNFKTMEQENLTVDEFILKNQEANTESYGSMGDEAIESQIPQNIPFEQRQAIKAEVFEKMNFARANLSKQNNELVLQEGRNQLSEMVGKKVTGTEKIADVFAGLVNEKINSYFQPQIGDESQSALLPFIFTLVLFLTIAPLGSILSRIWFLLVILLFKIFVKAGLVEIKTEMVEKESIQY
jgi:hypothetical protein